MSGLDGIGLDALLGLGDLTIFGVTLGVVIDVSDTGAGISAANLEHVFDRLWRADPSRSRSGGGSGLGLAIARRIAQAHGGDITVTSCLGQGSAFALRLPALGG